MTVRPAFYRREADGFMPTGLGASPWTPGAQMGVGLGALLVHAFEAVPSPVPMVTARITIDILGAVPMEKLSASTRIVREGKRVQLVEAELQAAGRVWVRGTALRLRTEPSPEASVALLRPLPEEPAPSEPGQWVQTIRLVGDYRVPGPGASWIWMTNQLIEGEALTPLQAITMVADFGSGTAALVPMESWTFANVDIAIHLTRAPHAGWLLIDSTSESAGNGVGLTHSRLGDSGGMIGIAHQTTYLNRR